MDNQQERLSFNKGWVIGLIDGEGSVLITKKPRGFYPSIQIGNCRVEVVDKLKDTLDSLGVPYYICPSTKTASGKTFQRVDIGGLKRLQRFFQALPIELFECKHEEIRLLKEYLDLRESKEPNEAHGPDEYMLYSLLKGYGGR